MKRLIILIVVLALGVAACGGDAGASQTDEDQPTASPTAEATAEPTESAEPSEAAATDDDDGGTALADLIPDELNGVPRTDVPGMDTFIASALQAQNIDAEGAEFVFASYGEDANAVILTAFRLPGVPEGQMELLARMLSGAEGAEGLEAETVDIGGKSVLRMSAAAGAGGDDGLVYMYFAEGAAFTIVSPSADAEAAEQLLAELP